MTSTESKDKFSARYELSLKYGWYIKTSFGSTYQVHHQLTPPSTFESSMRNWAAEWSAHTLHGLKIYVPNDAR